jgi:hypothetical protein
MSYIRYNSPLRYLKGISSSYVFPSYRRNKEDETDSYVEDYDDKFADKATLIDLVCRIVERESEDQNFAFRIAKALAKHMGVENMMREHPLTGDEWVAEENAISKKLHNDPSYREFLQALSKENEVKKVDHKPSTTGK